MKNYFKIYLDIIERDEKLALKLSNYLCDLILNWNKDKNIITFFEIFYLCYKNNTFAKYEKIIDEINVILGNMMGNEYILIKLKQYNFLVPALMIELSNDADDWDYDDLYDVLLN